MKHNNIGEKVLGWFIVQDDEDEDVSSGKKPRPADDDTPPTTKSPSEPVPVKATKATKATPPSPSTKSRPSSSSKPVSVTSLAAARVEAGAFEDLYRASGLPNADCERLAKVLELLASLPREATQEVKRTIVGAAMSAFDVPIDQIVASANGAVSALDAYAAASEHQTSNVVAQAVAKIATLTAEIAEAHRVIEEQRASQEELERAAALEKSRVRTAIDFFSDQRPPHRPQLVRLK